MRQIVLIAHNLRSCHNVGSLLRTAEGLGVRTVYLTGYTPYPLATEDVRLPHFAAKLDRQIHKTALGAERLIAWQYAEDVVAVLAHLKAAGFDLVAIEQAAYACSLPDYRPPNRVALLVGREVEGIEPSVLKQMDQVVEVPMFGKKESFNVTQAATMALYHCRFVREA